MVILYCDLFFLVTHHAVLKKKAGCTVYDNIASGYYI